MKLTRFSHFFANVVLLLLGIALVWLYWSDRLGLYIRPDYHIFTYVMGVILLFVGYAGFWVKDGHEHHHGQRKTRHFGPLLGSLLFLVLWGYLVFGPRYSLSSRAATNRGVNQNAASGASWELDTQQNVSPLLSLSQTENYTLADWTRLLRRDPEPRSHEGKTVSLIGFVQADPEGTYSVARFIVSCCVVDASPLALPVDAPRGDLADGQWIQLKGTLAIKDRGGKRTLVITPDSVEKIAEPELPYLY